MSGPIEIKERLMQCIGAGECTSRPLTEEEKHKFDNIKPQKRARFIPTDSEEIFEMEDLSMNPKIEAPEKEKLIEVLSQVQGKTKSAMHAAKVFKASYVTVFKWAKDYGLDWDRPGNLIVSPEAKENKTTESEKKLEIEPIPVPPLPKAFEEALEDVRKVMNFEASNIKDKPSKTLGYAEHDIGNAVLQLDFRDKLANVKVEKAMTFEEAIGVAEKILEVLAGE